MIGYCKGAELQFISRRAEYGKTVFSVSKLDGDWPGDEQLLLFCDKLRGAPFGGRVNEMPNKSVKEIHIYSS